MRTIPPHFLTGPGGSFIFTLLSLGVPEEVVLRGKFERYYEQKMNNELCDAAAVAVVWLLLYTILYIQYDYIWLHST